MKARVPISPELSELLDIIAEAIVDEILAEQKANQGLTNGDRLACATHQTGQPMPQEPQRDRILPGGGQSTLPI